MGFFDEKNTSKRLLDFSKVKVFQGKKIPSVLKMTDLSKKNSFTEITYKDIQWDLKIHKDFFSLESLKEPF